jgi:hypothetical protein
MNGPATPRSRGRDMAVVDTFTLDEGMQLALTAESVKMMRLAALARACRVARRTGVHAEIGSLAQYREHARALENVLLAAETYIGMTREEEES